MKNLIIISFLLLFVLNGFGQKIITTEDSIEVANMVKILEKKAREWKQEHEAWKYLSFNLPNVGLIINYGQQAAHPFLAEYNRTIQFTSKKSRTFTLEMTMNTGGRTFIDVYYDPTNKLVILEDIFGSYFYNLKSNIYSEKPYEKFEKTENIKYLGAINGKDYPLKFEKE